MRARTPAETIDALLTLRARVDAQIVATLGRINHEPPRRRSKFVTPECGTETAYQRHRYTSDTATDERRVTCPPCVEAHRLHERIQYAQRKYGKAAQ